MFFFSPRENFTLRVLCRETVLCKWTRASSLAVCYLDPSS